MSRAFNLLTCMLVVYAMAVHGCRCIEPQLQTTYFNPDYNRIVTAKLLFTSAATDYNYYAFQVAQVYKGCKLFYFVAKSAKSSAACGVTLNVGTTYIVPLADAHDLPVINSCQFIRSVDSLTQEEQSFLANREVCCGKTCGCVNGQPPVNCFVAPCSVTTCPENTTCVDNYCGGCNADCIPI